MAESTEQPLIEKTEDEPKGTTDMYNVLMLSTCFFVLFSAYNSIQNIISSLLPSNLGNLSLGIVYVSIALAVFIAPTVVHRYGEKRGLLLGGCCYFVYCGALIHPFYGTVVVASVIIGVGTGILWISMSAFLMKCTVERDLGMATGVFWALYQGSNVVGNLGVYGLFNRVNHHVLFAILTGVCILGAALMLLLRPLDESRIHGRSTTQATPAITDVDASSGATGASIQREQERRVSSSGAGEEPPQQSIVQHVLGSIKLLGDRRMLLLSPMFLFSGMELGFWTAEFTQLLPSDKIGLVLSCAGLGEVFGGLVVSRLSDTVGRTPTMLFGSVLFAIAFYLSVYLHKHPDATPQFEDCPWFSYVAAALFGLADSIANTQSFAILGVLFPEELGNQASDEDAGAVADEEGATKHPQRSRSSNADLVLGIEEKAASGNGESFTSYLALQNVGSALAYFGAIPIPLHGADGKNTQVYILGILLVVASLLYAYADPSFLKSCRTTSRTASRSISR